MAKTRSPHDPKFDRLAVALGHICIGWSRLERDLDEFIELLAPLEAGDISRSVTAGMDIRDKVQAVRALAYLRKPNDRWFKTMLSILDYIDNDLRVRRNRYIHDGWYIPEGKLTRFQKQIKLEKPNSFQLRLVTERQFRDNISAIEMLATELSEMFMPIFTLWLEASGGPRKSLPTAYARRFARRLKLSARRRNVHLKRQLPQKLPAVE